MAGETLCAGLPRPSGIAAAVRVKTARIEAAAKLPFRGAQSPGFRIGDDSSAGVYSGGPPTQRCPGLETADKVGRTRQSQPLQGVCSEAGAVALVADDHDPPSGVVSEREPVGAGRIEPPLEHVSVNDNRSRKITVPVSLIDRPRVNNKGPCCHLPLKIRSVNTLKPHAALK